MVRDACRQCKDAAGALLTMRNLNVPRHDGDRQRRLHQSVIAMARSAWRSRAESFSVSDFNWPQAARMSRPRGVRTGEE